VLRVEKEGFYEFIKDFLADDDPFFTGATNLAYGKSDDHQKFPQK